MSTKFILGKAIRGIRDSYKLMDIIHEGGMGVIYRGIRISDGLNVAVKISAKKNDGYDNERIRRLRREIEVLKALSHRNIVKYIDEGVWNGKVFLVTEYLSGKVLKDVNGFTRIEALNIFREIVDAIEYMHSKGYVYGDLKPGNIILVNERPVLIDFGTARNIEPSKLTLFEYNALTPEWAAPEQFERQAFKETDVYQLGLLLFYMLTGENPKKYMTEF